MPKKISSKLSLKVFLMTVSMLVICCLCTYFLISWYLPKTYLRQIDDDNVAYTEELSRIIDDIPFEEAIDLLLSISHDLDDDVYIHIFNEVGNGIDLNSLSATNDLLSNYKGIHATPPYSFSPEGENRTYFILMAINTKPVNQATDSLKKVFPLIFLFIIFISSACAFLYSLYLTKPVLKISKAAHRMAKLDFEEKLEIVRTDEIGSLSQDLNSLSVKLVDTLNDLKQANTSLKTDIEKERDAERKRIAFFSSASHELKTPIAVIKGQLEGMLYRVGTYKDREKYLVRSIEVANGLEKTVLELLMVSRMDAPEYTLNRHPFNLGTVLLERLHAHEDLLIKKEIESQQVINPNIFVNADQQLIVTVIDNIIINAINYSPNNSSIINNLFVEDNMATISIENTNVQIETTEISHLFDAFYCVEKSHNRQTGGSGLGLYVVKTILEQHNAYYSIGNTASGVEFIFSLPLHESN